MGLPASAPAPAPATPASLVTPWQTAKASLACVYLATAFVWSMPTGFPLQELVVAAAARPFHALGLWQAWDMFAPDPMPTDVAVSAVAFLADGGELEWPITAVGPGRDPFKRYATERWRRFCNDRLRLEANKSLWPGAAAWFARAVERNTGRRVDRLVLWRHWRPVVPPEPDGGQPPLPEWSRVPFHAWLHEPATGDLP